MATQYNRDNQIPDVQVVRYDHRGDRSLTLRHRRHRARPLDDDAEQVLRHLQRLWGFTVRLVTVDENDKEIGSREIKA